ncbi:MAG: glycosyltransferase family 4 protein [Geobacter sp.]|nr:glycosyltransferase family 4 protein [Geobacter sp.]
MKIALVRQKYTPFGGAERYMARLVEGLVARGHKVHVFAAKWDAENVTGVTLHRVPVVSLSGWLKALTFAWNCRRMLQGERFDVIFSLERTIFQDIYRAGDGCHRQWLVQKSLGKPDWSRFATLCNPLHHAYLFLEKKLFTDERLRAIIANSGMVRDDIIRHYGVSPEKIRVVYNGLDPAQFEFGRREECRGALAREFSLNSELRLLYVGSGFERKGVPALLRAVSRLEMPFRLFVVGKGNLRRFQRMAELLGIADRVIFTGPRRDVETFYLGSDLFVFPTLYDPFSNATLEAMLCGLPVVTTSFNGVAELVENGVNGWVVPDPLDVDGLASAIMRLASSPDLAQIGIEARKTAAGLTMERNTSETLRVIEELVESRVR